MIELNDDNVGKQLLTVINNLDVIKNFDKLNKDTEYKRRINNIFRNFDEAGNIEFSKKDIVKKLFTVLYRYYKAGYKKIDFYNDGRIFLIKEDETKPMAIIIDKTLEFFLRGELCTVYYTDYNFEQLNGKEVKKEFTNLQIEYFSVIQQFADGAINIFCNNDMVQEHDTDLRQTIMNANSLKPDAEWEKKMEDELDKATNENKCLCSLNCLKYNGKWFGLC